MLPLLVRIELTPYPFVPLPIAHQVANSYLFRTHAQNEQAKMQKRRSTRYKLKRKIRSIRIEYCLNVKIEWPPFVSLIPVAIFSYETNHWGHITGHDL